MALRAIPGLPLVEPGTPLAETIATSMDKAGVEPEDGDILAVAQKIVSKAEGRLVALGDIEPSPAARNLAAEIDKDARVVELILRESRRVIRHRPGMVIVEHRLGIIMANAGIDRSNVAGPGETVLLLPEDPDASAAAMKRSLEARLGVRLGVLITDSVGRPWRLGTTGIAIGCAGVPVLEDLRGDLDLFGRVLEVSEVATADAVAAAAGLLMGEAAEGSPVVLIRGLGAGASSQTARAVLRPAEEDLFR